MAVDYSSWTVSRLEKERTKIEKALESQSGKERQRALAEMEAVAKKSGYEVKDLLAEFGLGRTAASKPRGKKKSAKGSTGKVAPKYRSPDDRKITWSGRGRKPKWIEAHLTKNDNLDALKI